MALIRIFFYLVVMILVLALAYYTTKVLGNGVGKRQEHDNFRVLDRLAVGRDTFLLVVKVQNQIFLLGVSPAGIEKLGELDEYEKSPAAEPSDFASILAEHVKPYLDKSGREKKAEKKNPERWIPGGKKRDNGDDDR